MFIWGRACGVGLLWAGLFAIPTCPAAEPGSIDLTFQPEHGGPAYRVTGFCVQRDGRIVSGGSPIPPTANAVMRWLPDGSIDSTFNTPAVLSIGQTPFVWNIVEQRDGKLVISGFFSSINGVDRGAIARLNRDGSLDDTFRAGFLPSGSALAMALQSDGRFLVGGGLANTNPNVAMARLHPDGSLDSSFAVAADGVVHGILIEDRRILIAGTFQNINGASSPGIAAVNFAGALDPGFASPFESGAVVTKVARAPDGKIYAAGSLTLTQRRAQNIQKLPHTSGTASRGRPEKRGIASGRQRATTARAANVHSIVRLHRDGVPDSTFRVAPAFDQFVYALAAQTNGQVLLAQNFGATNRIARLNTDGSRDAAFVPAEVVGWAVNAMTLDAQERTLVGGLFTVPAAGLTNMMRLNGNVERGPSLIEFDHATYSVSEADSHAVINIIRKGDVQGSAAFDLFTQDRGAFAGQHYSATRVRLRFASDEVTKAVNIPLFDNDRVDGPRSFIVGLTNVVGGELGSNAAATITITDDEVADRVQFSASYFPVKETESNVLVEVVREFGSPGAMRVAFRTRDGTALAGRDYLSVTGTLDFAAGQFTNSFVVPILNTSSADGNRYAELELFDPQNSAVLGCQSNATLALLDDESPAVVAVPLEAFVRAAVAGGGSRVEFGADGSIAMRGALNINADVTLDGGSQLVTLSGEGATRLFHVATGVNLTLKNLTLANGFSTNGGAIWNEGNLTLVNCTFSNNVARGEDGRDGAVREAAMGEDGGHGLGARGGALVNLGRVVVTNCLFIGNAAFGGRGGDGGEGGLGTNYWDQFPGGNGGNSGFAQGGAIFSLGPVIAGQTRFYSNVAVAGRSGVGGRGTVTNIWLGWWQIFNAYAGTNGLAADAQGGALDITGSFAGVGCEFLANEAVGGLGSASVGNGDGTDYRSAFPGLPGSNGGNAAGGSVHATGDAFFRTSSFIHNIARGGSGGLGGGGGSGEGIARVWPNNGGDGGRGGHGGTARSGAIDISGGTLDLQACSLESNRAIGGDGSNGGHGGVAGGNGFGGGAAGAGGDGGDGGDAIAGAILAERVGTFLDNQFEGNSAIGGLAANGSQSGQRCCRYSDSAPAGNGGAGGNAVAGAVFIQRAAPMIASSIFFGNTAHAGVGGIGARGTDFTGGSSFSSAANSGGNGGDGGDAQAGALMLDAPAAISNCTFSFSASVGGNAGPGGTGGASYGAAGHGGLSGRGGRASAGAVFSSQGLSIADTFLTTNTALAGDANIGGNGGNLGGYGGTIAYPYMLGSGAPGANGGDAKGGALFLASNVVSISRVRLIANTTHAGAGGEAGTNGGISYGTGPLLVSPEGGSGGGAFGGGVFAENSTLALVDSTFESNATIGGVSGASGTGGRSLTTIGGQTHPGWPSRSGVPGGEARGAGLCSEISDVAVSRCTFNLNAAVGGQGAMGGARFDLADNGGTGGIGGGASGGAMAQFGGRAFLTNSTFHSNSVVGGVGGMGGANNGGAPGGIGGDGFGGALHNVTSAVVLVNASLVENFAAAGAGGSGGTGETNTLGPTGASGNAFGGALANVDAQFSIVNSLFKHRANASSAFGAFIDLGHNISSDASFAFTESTSRNNLDPLVGPLRDNGGPTPTMALLSGSPAIDAGDDATCPPTDQRGVSRPFGAHCDIGAFELSERTFSISGRVKAHGTVAGIVVSVGGASAMTDSSGLYTLRNLIGDRYEVRPLGAGRFSPARRVVTVGPDARQINFNAHLPRLRATTVDNRGTIVLHLTDLADDGYVLETSTNLVDWKEVEAISADRHGSAVLQQLVNTNDARRYFRLGASIP